MDDGQRERNGTPLSTFERGADAGWFPDPAGIYSQRYWNGDRWTDNVVDRNGVRANHHLRARVATPDIDLTADEPAEAPEPAGVDHSAAAFATRVLERACLLADVDCRSNAMTADEAIAALPNDLAEATVRVMQRTYAAAGDTHNATWAQTKLDEIRARPPVETTEPDETPEVRAEEPDDEPEPEPAVELEQPRAEAPAPDTSAPATPTESSVPAAWYPDPGARHQHRYWNGDAWTDRVADDGVQAIDPLSWDPPSTEVKAAAASPVGSAEASSGGLHKMLERIRAMRTFWIISTVVFAVLTIGYLLLPVTESATSIDGAHTVSLHCGSVLSPDATATRGADITNASSVCSAARHSNTTRVYFFAALAFVSVALAAFARASSSDEPDREETRTPEPRPTERLVL